MSKVEACLQLLRSAKDEEKFAGLLLVTRVFARSDSAALVSVLGAVDARFLARLLRHPTDTGAAYRTVALNILFFNAFGGSAELFVLVYCCACFLLFLRFLFLFVFNLRAADVFVFFFRKRPKRIS